MHAFIFNAMHTSVYSTCICTYSYGDTIAISTQVAYDTIHCNYCTLL